MSRAEMGHVKGRGGPCQGPRWAMSRAVMLTLVAMITAILKVLKVFLIFLKLLDYW